MMLTETPNDPHSFSHSAQRSIPWGLCTFLLMLAVWVGLTTPLVPGAAPLVRPLKLASPLVVYQLAINLNSVLLGYTAQTLLRVSIGLTIGSLVGIAAGLAMAHSHRLAQAIDPIIEGARPVPALAVFPLVILWLGLGWVGQMTVVGLGVFVVVVVGVYESGRRIDKRFLRVTRSLGADCFTLQRMTVFPMIAPALVGILRVASATAFTTTIGAEFLGAQGGLGFFIRNARITLNTEGIMLGVLLIGLLSWVMDRAIRAVGRKMTRWVDQENVSNS